MGEEGAVKVDLTHAFNRLADQWFDLFTGSVETHMPGLACAYPGHWDEATQQAVRSTCTPSSYSLRWGMAQKATDSNWETRRLFSSIGWDLRVHWTGLTYVHEDQTYTFIDDAMAYVALTDPSQSLSLNVQGMFSHPSFYGDNASLPVYFHVVVHDGSTTIRDDQRGFTIYGDGSRQHFM